MKDTFNLTYLSLFTLGKSPSEKGMGIYMKIKNMKNYKFPLKWSMVWMIVMGWLLPLMVIGFCLLYFVSSMVSNQIEKTIRISTNKAVEICELHLNEILIASKNASYNTTIRDSYVEYQIGGTKSRLQTNITHFLNQQYKYDINLLCTVVFFLDEPQNIFYTYNTYHENNDIATGYSRVQFFADNVLDTVKQQSDSLDTATVLIMHSGRVYMVRNLVNSSFIPYGMIAIELSPRYVFESLNSVWGAERYEVYIDGTPVMGNDHFEYVDLDEIRSIAGEQSGYISKVNGTFAYRVINYNEQEMIYLVKLDTKTLIDDVSMLRWVLVLVLVFMIPLMFIIFQFFHVKVTKPVAKLVKASKEIGEGNYGHIVEETGNSQEFEYLDNAFNAMSAQLKYQFEKIYLEELALKDANIMALQAQINPHFLNNTLEIINWEARMNGNDKVSRMIEALATMLNATMNRGRKRFITLAEELDYVNAYLYIIKQRTGERFHVHREIDESLLDYEVPLLIIQPIIENAVEHGMQGSKDKEVSLRIYSEEDKIYIEVINNKALDEKDKARIDYLLGDDVQDENEQHISLGIRNVDRRLKIIYGDSCGLTIKSRGNETVSTIIVKIEK